MKISIFGLGYVGAVSLACLARDGHDVIGVDIDATKLDLIRQGKTPVVEEGMVDLMKDVVAAGRVTVTTDAVHAVLNSDISLVCVGTPSAANLLANKSAVAIDGPDADSATGAYATDANTLLAVDDELWLVLVEEGTATLPLGAGWFEGLYT